MEEVTAPTIELENCNNRFDIEFIDLGYSVTERKGITSVQHNILKGTSGSFKSGHLTAVLGASGAGKSTLLNVLSGFRTHGITGTILINGHERKDSQFKKCCCYIPQDFAMMSYLTAEETLMIAADLKLGIDIKKTKKKSLVNEILQLLGLLKAKSTLVGKLSGGEKKRLSIGVELLTNPPVMFFDEPTSGLDSISSLQILTYLRSLAQAGRTVICSIHQPSSRLFEMFDDILLLADGQCLYSGPLDELTNVLQEEGFICPKYYNRADFAIEVACKERGDSVDNLISRFKSGYLKSGEVATLNDIHTDGIKLSGSTEGEMTILMPVAENCKELYEYSVPAYFHLFVLTKRAMICTYRNLYLGIVRFLTHLLVGLLFGVMCYDVGNDASKVPTNISCIFLFTTFLFSLSPVLTVLCFPLESPVFLREHQNNWYSLKAYFTAKLISDLPLQIICPSTFVLVAYYLTGQPFDNIRPLLFWFLCLLLSICGQSMGFAVGAAFDVQMGLFILITMTIPMGLFCGFLVRVKDIVGYLQWFSNVSYYRFAFEGAMLIVYSNRPKLECSEIYCYFKYPSKLLEEFDLDKESLKTNFIGLVIWIIIFQAMFYCILKWRIYMSR